MQAVLIIGIGVLVSAFVAYAQAFLAHSSNTAIAGWLSNLLNNIPLFGGLTAAQVLKLDAWVTHQLGAHFKQVESKAVGWIAGMSTYSKVVAAAGLNLAAAQWAFAVWAVHVAIPKHTKARVAPVARTAGKALAIARRAEEGVYNLSHGHRTTVKPSTITRIEHVALPHASEWTWINHHWNALVKAVTAPVTLPGVVAVPEVTKLWGWTRRNLRWHNRRIARLEALLGVGVFAATMAKVIGVTPRCLGRNGNVGRLARALCGLDRLLISGLLATSFEAFAVLDLCQFIKVEVKLAEWLQPLLMDFVDVDEWLIQNCGYQKAPDLTLPVISLPSGSYGVTLNGPRDVALGLAS